jgi:hypothetical protein
VSPDWAVVGVVVVRVGAVVTVAGTVVVVGTGICTPGGSELICRQW